MTEGVAVEGGKFADAVLRASSGRGVDVILELVGGDYLTDDLVCAAPRARIVLVGLLAGGRADLDLGLILRKRLTLVGTVLRSRPLEEKIDAMQRFSRHVVPLFSSGQLVPIVELVLPLSRAAEAHARMARSEGFGKIVLSVDAPEPRL
jgi:NADPH:quinone reductase-like Zn-dependent oxidoreductase